MGSKEKRVEAYKMEARQRIKAKAEQIRQQKLAPTEGIRYDTGKTAYHLLPPCLGDILARVVTLSPSRNRPEDFYLWALSEATRAHGERDIIPCLTAALTHALNGMVVQFGLSKTVDLLVQVLEFGAKKYTPFNWAKGMDWTRCLRPAIGHLSKLDTLDDDPVNGTQTPHVANAVIDLGFLLEYAYRNLGRDDRYPFPPKKDAA